jgi:ABC-type uncharacterized transport system involved in gliding motility auxiliary subunit
MFVALIGRLLGAVGLLALALFTALSVFAPDAPGLTWLGATAAVGIGGWIYLDWAALGRFVQSRGGRDQGVSIALIAAVAGIAGLVFHLGERAPKRWDLTEDQRHSLSEQAAAVVRDVPASVRISVTGFFMALGDQRQEQQRQTFTRLGEAVRAVNPAIDWEAVDPVANPRRALEAGNAGNGTVIVAALRDGKERTERLFDPEEAELANALLRLGGDRAAAVYFVTGHGELEIGELGDDGLGTLAGSLKAVGLKVDSLETRRVEAIPADAELLVVAGPRAPFSEGEVAMIRTWVEQGGGSVLLAVEPNLPGRPASATGWEGVLPDWGVKLRPDLVLDELMHSYVGDATSVISSGFGYHDITDHLTVPTVFPTARSIMNVNEDPSAQTVFELVVSSEAAWGETRLEEGAAQRDEEDTQGPVILATLSELHREGVEHQGKVLVVGDADWLTDGGISGFGNADLAQRSIAYLAEQDDLVTIPPKAKAATNMTLDLLQSLLVMLAAVLVVPGGVLLAGLLVFLWRRSL